MQFGQDTTCYAHSAESSQHATWPCNNANSDIEKNRRSLELWPAQTLTQLQLVKRAWRAATILWLLDLREPPPKLKQSVKRFSFSLCAAAPMLPAWRATSCSRFAALSAVAAPLRRHYTPEHSGYVWVPACRSPTPCLGNVLRRQHSWRHHTSKTLSTSVCHWVIYLRSNTCYYSRAIASLHHCCCDVVLHATPCDGQLCYHSSSRELHILIAHVRYVMQWNVTLTLSLHPLSWALHLI